MTHPSLPGGPPGGTFVWEWGGAIRPIAGERVSGDGYVVIERDWGVLVSLADGLGHGAGAARATDAFAAFVRAHADLSLGELVDRCHRALIGTRGVVASFLKLRTSPMEAEFIGVGNIVTRLLRGRAAAHGHFVSRPGVLGGSFRRAQIERAAFVPGDTFIAHSDGISSRFDAAPFSRMTAQAMADAILEKHGKNHDDASCVVIRARVVRPSTSPPSSLFSGERRSST